MKFPVFGSHTASPSTAAASNISITASPSAGAFSTSTTQYRSFCPFRLQMSLFSVDLVTAPGVGKSWTFVLQKNGVDTALSVTISGTNTVAFTTTENVLFEEDDYVYFRAVPSGTPSAPTAIRWTVMVDTMGRPEYFWWHSYGAPSVSARSYASASASGSSWQTSVTAISTMSDLSHSATITKVKWWFDRDPGAAKNYVASIYKDGAEEASSQGTLNSASQYVTVDNLNISVVSGSRIKISTLPSGTPASGHLSSVIVYKPVIMGESSMSATCYNPVSGATFWQRFANSYTTPNTTAEDTTREFVPPNVRMYIKNLLLTQESAPGSGKSYAYTLTNGGSDTALTCTVSDLNKVASDTTHVVAVDGATSLAIKGVPSGTPANTNGIVNACTIYIPPSDMKGNQ